MVSNNGQYLYQRTPQSSVLETNPFLDANGRDTGTYVNPPAAGYRRETYDKDTHNRPRQVSNQVVWSFRSANSHSFSHIGSSAQRLPNGNTSVGSDPGGHLFFDLILGRPTSASVTVSVLCYEDTEGPIAHQTQPGMLVVSRRPWRGCATH